MTEDRSEVPRRTASAIRFSDRHADRNQRLATLDGQTYDATPTHVVERPADITAAGLRQLLRQFDRGRVIVVMTRGRRHRQRRRAGRDAQLGRAAARRQSAAETRPGAAAQPAPPGRRPRAGRGRWSPATSKLRQQAADVGIPVFGSVQGAQEQPWDLTPSRLDYVPPSPARDPRQPVSAKRRGLLAARFRTVRAGRRRSQAAAAAVRNAACCWPFCCCSSSRLSSAWWPSSCPRPPSG